MGGVRFYDFELVASQEWEETREILEDSPEHQESVLKHWGWGHPERSLELPEGPLEHPESSLELPERALGHPAISRGVPENILTVSRSPRELPRNDRERNSTSVELPVRSQIKSWWGSKVGFLFEGPYLISASIRPEVSCAWGCMESFD